MSWPKHRDGETAATSCRFLRLSMDKWISCNFIQVTTPVSGFSISMCHKKFVSIRAGYLGLARINAARQQHREMHGDLSTAKST